AEQPERGLRSSRTPAPEEAPTTRTTAEAAGPLPRAAHGVARRRRGARDRRPRPMPMPKAKGRSPRPPERTRRSSFRIDPLPPLPRILVTQDFHHYGLGASAI